MALDLDMAEIHEVFFEESGEGLDVMESGLLNLDIGAADIEVMNNIFRAAHSIKGGAATFGFMDISNFTHNVETLLDEMRSGDRVVTQESVQLLLATVDHLRDMFQALHDDVEIDSKRSSELVEKLEIMLGEKPSDDTSPQTDVSTQESSSTTGETTGATGHDATSTKKLWRIEFAPYPEMLETCNDPLRLFRELTQFGKLNVTCDTGKLPNFRELDPEKCFLSWSLELQSNVSRNEIDYIFEWVEDYCDLTITTAGGQQDEDNAALENQQETVTQAEQKPAVNEKTVTDKAAAVQATPKKATPSKSPARKSTTPADGGSIRVGIDKIDDIINLVGELVITQSMLNRFTENFDMSQIDDLSGGLNQLTRNMRELQESVMRIRMLPISFSFNRFPRLVHDLCQKLDKKVELILQGEQTELDKTVLEKISDPLVHLVRNSLDHGIERPEARIAAGKPETGQLTLSAFHEGGSIVIEVIDDGAGINKEVILNKAIKNGIVGPDEELSDERIYNLIFSAGLSTAEKLSDVSGRGVGMDVVKRNITDLGGHVTVQSVLGKGTTLSIRLPLTLAILDGQLVRIGLQTYVISLVSIIETVQITDQQNNAIVGKAEVYKLRDEYIPIIRLYDLFGVESDSTELTSGLLVIVESDGRRVGLLVDELLAQQQVVIKSLDSNFRGVPGLSGATILGDGKVSLILDVPGIIELFYRTYKYSKQAVAAVA